MSSAQVNGRLALGCSGGLDGFGVGELVMLWAAEVPSHSSLGQWDAEVAIWVAGRRIVPWTTRLAALLAGFGVPVRGNHEAVEAYG